MSSVRMANPFDECSEEYRLFRPSYPAPLYDLLISGCALDATSRILDVGSGTGKGSAPLVERGIHVRAAEPSFAMIQQGQQSYPNLEYVCSTAEQLPFAPRLFDMVMSAQSFHWFDSTLALQETARVLKPTGFFAVFWNGRDHSFDHMRWFDELVKRFKPEHERYRRKDWTSILEADRLFKVVEYREFSFKMPMTSQTWIGLARSISYIRSMEKTRLAEFENALAEGMSSLPSIDAAYVTHLWLAQKTDHSRA